MGGAVVVPGNPWDSINQQSPLHRPEATNLQKLRHPAPTAREYVTDRKQEQLASPRVPRSSPIRGNGGRAYPGPHPDVADPTGGPAWVNRRQRSFGRLRAMSSPVTDVNPRSTAAGGG